jgi:serine/threonine protein kinase
MQPQLIAGRYQVLRAIGRGGMGTVWLCRDEVLGREVAVKQIGALPGESATETKRAMREARSAASVNHPNAVAVYDVVDHDGRPWLVMEYVEGETLADEIRRDGQLSPQRVADIGAQLAGALARAHQRRIVHRDIKPGNVLIDRAGRPKISDFGIARGHGDEQLTQVGFITGTPGYLSPELARGGDPHPASDVWALGATLYAAVEGQTPYESRSNPIAQLRAIATERPRPMTHAGALGPAIDAMMHEDPACRWDMATSARRLSSIARAGAPAYVSRAEPGATKVIPAGLPQSARALETTRQLAPVGTAAPLVVSAAPAVAAVAPVVAAENPPETATPAPAVPLTATPAPAADPVPQSEERGSGRRWIPLGLIALVVLLIGGFALPGLFGNQAGTAAVRPPGRAASPVKPATTAAPGAPKPSASHSGTTPTPSGTTVAVVPAPNDNKALENFVYSYFADVTRNRDATWAQLSPRMQARAKGRPGYESWWVTIRSVKVNRVQAKAAANTAVVNLTYTNVKGAAKTDTNTLTFVRNGAGYLIQSQR